MWRGRLASAGSGRCATEAESGREEAEATGEVVVG